MENMTGKVWILGDDIDTDIMANREYAEELNKKADAMLEKYTKIADETFESVLGRLK